MNIVKPVFALFLSAIFSIAAEASTEVTRVDCGGLSVKISNYRDAESLFLALPESSESLGDSALWRASELRSSHDGIRISCALSSGYQGVCSVVYTRNSATTDSCDTVPDHFPVTASLAAQLTKTLELPAAGYTTKDRTFSLSCTGASCALAIRR